MELSWAAPLGEGAGARGQGPGEEREAGKGSAAREQSGPAALLPRVARHGAPEAPSLILSRPVDELPGAGLNKAGRRGLGGVPWWVRGGVDPENEVHDAEVALDRSPSPMAQRPLGTVCDHIFAPGGNRHSFALSASR